MAHPTRRAALIAALLFVPASLTIFAMPAAAHDDPTYCRNNPADPRCKPDYCQFNPNDPWCWDPNYCERNPDDPICRKEQLPPKEICWWALTAAPPVAGASPGPAILDLNCPNHLLAKWDCGWKDGRSLLPVDDPTPSTPICTYVGQTASGAPCSSTHTWNVARPDLRTVTAWVQAHTWKDENCDGAADDWNSVNADGTCRYPNWYGPKHGWPWYPYTPAPDGVIDECDMQHYEFQWRQFN